MKADDIHYILKHELLLPDDTLDAIGGDMTEGIIGPFEAYQEGLISKGKLCEIIAEAIITYLAQE